MSQLELLLARAILFSIMWGMGATVMEADHRAAFEKIIRACAEECKVGSVAKGLWCLSLQVTWYPWQ